MRSRHNIYPKLVLSCVYSDVKDKSYLSVNTKDVVDY